VEPLAPFSPETRAWFERTFAEPTPAQALGWPAIATGKHTLIQAPTGSGKTLAAFLYGSTADSRARRGLRLLYVSPLKALNYDIERNLRGPLAGLRPSCASPSAPATRRRRSARGCCGIRPTS
jgi:ATP-dependent Lhr-like helicase